MSEPQIEILPDAAAVAERAAAYVAERARAAVADHGRFTYARVCEYGMSSTQASSSCFACAPSSQVPTAAGPAL